ncbi:AAA family ATPase [Virgibacillus halodenitrificans]|uniref:AAA family ATPase n=1 Tax=Virgibacillus halodenitrificans TaxID=1482 RepID=UPI000760DEBC
MDFEVLDPDTRPTYRQPDTIFLIRDRWDDWFEFETQYHMSYYNEEGDLTFIGNVKIGEFNMESGQRRPNIENSFEALNDCFFSLGQEEEYYQNLNKIGEEFRYQVLTRLKDVALNQELFRKAAAERVMDLSLMRGIAKSSVKGRLRKLANGDASLTHYSFIYKNPNTDIEVSFEVHPNSKPPTNIHSIIGRNGVGKTHLLNNMIRSILYNKNNFGRFTSYEDLPIEELFANLVFVSFSAFDSKPPVLSSETKEFPINYSYIGLKEEVDTNKEGSFRTKSTNKLTEEFVVSLLNCINSAKRTRWQEAVQMLESDPVFNGLGITQIPYITDDIELIKYANKLFDKKLSSGHKIVLLTITKLVEKVEEKSLVILDEPEAHLHPPLLSAFVRSLSNLLIKRNGVAITATHSPVILQEIPYSCAWKIRRVGEVVVTERLEIESFGENIGSLTREVFGLEVINSGFHKMLLEAVLEYRDYDKVVEHFNGELGKEALFIIQSLLINLE